MAWREKEATATGDFFYRVTLSQTANNGKLWDGRKHDRKWEALFLFISVNLTKQRASRKGKRDIRERVSKPRGKKIFFFRERKGRGGY